MADEELEMVQKTKQNEMDENKGVVNGWKKSENEKPMLGCSEETRKEVQEESVRAEEDTMIESPSGKEGERCGDDGIVGGQKQEETKSVSKK